MSYKDAGVDIDAGAELVRRIQKLNPSIGGFSGLVPFGTPCFARHTAGTFVGARKAASLCFSKPRSNQSERKKELTAVVGLHSYEQQVQR